MIDVKKTILLPGGRVAESLNEIEETGGLYCVFFRNGVRLLERSGYFGFCTDMPLCIRGAHLLSAGATSHSLRQRIGFIFKNDSRGSSLRWTVGAILRAELRLVGNGTWQFGSGERRLTEWLLHNALISYVPTPEAKLIEEFVIRSFVTPFNISHRKAHPYSKHLLKLRASTNGGGSPSTPRPTASPALVGSRKGGSRTIH